jgi:hypothetical protein
MMQTTIHYYRYDLCVPAQKKQWEALRKKLSKDPRYHLMHVHNGQDLDIYPKDEVVTLETDFLFSNQWNTPEKRVFDWFWAYQLHTKSIAQGHWLEITPEMEKIRAETFVCGYCGKYSKDPARKFCDQCLGSEYLKPNDHYLLRLLPVADHHPKRKPLTEAEQAILLPLYNKAQGLGASERNAKRLGTLRQKIAQLVPDAKAKAKADIEAAEIETAGKTWLLDHFYDDIENVIYYPHIKTFGFGWRKMTEDPDQLRDLLRDFPFVYSIR